MLAPIATIAFLATLWFVAKLALDAIAADGGKIGAALKGQSLSTQQLLPVSVRFQPRAEAVRRPIRARSEWRAAA